MLTSMNVPSPRRLALAQRQQDVHHRRIGGAGDVGGERRRHHAMPRLPGRQRQQAGVADVVEVVAGAVAARAGLAVAGDGAIDDARIGGAEGRVSEPEPVHDAGAELLHHHVGGLGERKDAVAHLRVFQVGRHALLAAVEQREADALLTPFRLEAAHVLAVRALDLDDLGAGFRQHQRRQGARQQRGEVEHADTGERALFAIRHDVSPKAAFCGHL